MSIDPNRIGGRSAVHTVKLIKKVIAVGLEAKTNIMEEIAVRAYHAKPIYNLNPTAVTPTYSLIRVMSIRGFLFSRTSFSYRKETEAARIG